LLAGYATIDSDVIAVPVKLQVPGQVNRYVQHVEVDTVVCFLLISAV
jgi:hypothetical protein